MTSLPACTSKFSLSAYRRLPPLSRHALALGATLAFAFILAFSPRIALANEDVEENALDGAIAAAVDEGVASEATSPLSEQEPDCATEVASEEVPDATADEACDSAADEADDATGALEAATVDDTVLDAGEPAETTADNPVEATLEANADPDVLADGDYIIRTMLANRSVLDVSGGSSANGANVQLYEYNGTPAQKWHIAASAKNPDLYTIASLISNKVLDVSGAGTSNGTNVHIWEANGTDAQLWRIVRDGTGWRIVSALKADFVLDIAGGSSSNGTNAHAWTANGTAAQVFDLMAVDPYVAPSSATVAEGAYVLTNSASGKVLDISGASRNAGANAQQWQGNDTYAQRFYLQPDGDGYYRVFNISSGLALDVSGADLFPGANVQQWAYNGSNAQLWSLRAASGGAYTLVSKANGLALDIAGASSANGANLQTYTANGTKAQAFSLKSVPLLIEGSAHSFFAANSSNLAIDVAGASTAEGANLQLFTYNGTMAQKMNVTKAAGDGEFTLQVICSGLYVGTKGSSVVQTSGANAWKLAYSTTGERRGLVFVNADNKAIGASSAKSGTALALMANTASPNQAFLPTIVGIIDSGIYKIANVGSGKVLDVAGGNWSSGANIQQWTSNDSGAQAFSIQDVGNGYYLIVNAMTGRALDVAGAENRNGANVQQYQKNGTDAQLWKAEFDNGRFVFINKATNKALDVSGGKTTDGANVDIWERNNTTAQSWNLLATTYTPDPVLQRAIDNMNAQGSATNYCIAVDLTNTRVVIFEGSAYNWTPVYNWICSVGAPYTPTVTGHYDVGIKGYSFGHDGFTCYYYTQFWGDYLFHSVKYYAGTFNIMDGRLGEHISEGCVRLDINNAKWIYDNIPTSTHVYVYY